MLLLLVLGGLEAASAARPVNRFYHSFNEVEVGGNQHFPSSSVALPLLAVDNSIMMWDDALSAVQCDDLMAAFERDGAAQFAGAVMVDGLPTLDDAIKKNTELSISAEARAGRFKWFTAERMLEQTVMRHLNLYQESNIILASQQNPLGDEGFRLKRYLATGDEHHGYHADCGHETAANPHRILAILLYLNTVEQGGETVFLNQGVSISPVQGRLAIFPTSFSFVHAGRAPTSGSKYVVINFLTT